MAGLLAAVVLLLVGGTVVSTSLSIWAFKEKDRADENAQNERSARQQADRNLRQAREAVRFFDHVAEFDLRDLPGLTEVRRKLLERAVRYYSEFAAQSSDDPAFQLEQADSSRHAAGILMELGETEKALLEYDRSVAILERVISSEPSASIEVRTSLVLL